jgi:hypothetical protein
VKAKPKAVTAGDIEFLSLRESSLRGRLIFLLLFPPLFMIYERKHWLATGKFILSFRGICVFLQF